MTLLSTRRTFLQLSAALLAPLKAVAGSDTESSAEPATEPTSGADEEVEASPSTERATPLRSIAELQAESAQWEPSPFPVELDSFAAMRLRF